MGALRLLHIAARIVDLIRLTAFRRGGDNVFVAEPVSAIFGPSPWRAQMEDVPYGQKSYRKVPPTTARNLVS